MCKQIHKGWHSANQFIYFLGLANSTLAYLYVSRCVVTVDALF
jgi:hypothetical protein